MQLEIHLSPLDSDALSPNYLHEMSAAFYHALTASSPGLAAKLHDGEEKSRIKLFVFSPLNSEPHPQVVNDAGKTLLRFGRHIWLRFASIVPELVQGFGNALLEAGALRIANAKFKVEKVEMVRAPEWGERMVYRPFGQSGSIVCRFTSDGAVRYQFPDNRERGIPTCSELLAANLRHKLLRLGDLRPDILENILSVSDFTADDVKTLPIKVEFLPTTADRAFKSMLHYHKGVPIRSFRCPVIVTAPEVVHRVIWDAGLGASNSQGYGLMTSGRPEA